MLDLTITDQPFHRLMNPPDPELSGEIPVTLSTVSRTAQTIMW